MLDRQNVAMPSPGWRARPSVTLLAAHRHIAEVWQSILGARDAFPATGSISGSHVGVEDDPKPARRTKLHRLDLAVQRVEHVLAAPPALGLKRRPQIFAESFERGAVRHGIVQGDRKSTRLNSSH